MLQEFQSMGKRAQNLFNDIFQLVRPHLLGSQMERAKYIEGVVVLYISVLPYAAEITIHGEKEGP
jgi:hypothetical protein